MVEASKLSAQASRYKDETIPSLRGTIYASDGSTLAYSQPKYDVFVWMPDLQFAERKGGQTREELTRKLAEIIDKSAESIGKSISDLSSDGVGWIKIADNISVEQREKILTLTRDVDNDKTVGTRRFLSGINFQPDSTRIYPEKRVAAHIVGLTNVVGDRKLVGVAGLEAEWDKYLNPREGYVTGETDARGNAVGLAAEKSKEAIRGSSLYTSLDKRIQEAVQERLKWAVEYYGAKSGGVVVMQPKTGNIMALANYPDYDPNLREEKDPAVYGNKAVSEPYEIGSVGKIFTLSAAIDQGVVTPDTVVIQGHNGCEKVLEDLDPVCTHDKLPQPPMPIKQAFALSDNIYFLHLAQLMQPETFYDYLVKFGVGRKSAVDIYGESSGTELTDWREWNKSDQAAYSYGHSYQMNLVQVASAVSAVANDGWFMQPHLVTKVVDGDGREVDYVPTALRQIVKEDTVKQMDEMMYQIYKNNIYYWEHQYDDLRNYKIAMKSGTALIPIPGIGYTNKINATYAGYDASPDASFTMIVRLEDPKYGSLAGQNARVLWLEIFRDIKDIIGVKRIGQF